MPDRLLNLLQRILYQNERAIIIPGKFEAFLSAPAVRASRR